MRVATDFKESLMRIINDRNRREDEQEFQAFCEELFSLPANFELMPKGNFKADIELQPLRWMNLGMGFGFGVSQQILTESGRSKVGFIRFNRLRQSRYVD